MQPTVEVGPLGSQVALLIHIELDVSPKHMLRVTCTLEEKKKNPQPINQFYWDILN